LLRLTIGSPWRDSGFTSPVSRDCVRGASPCEVVFWGPGIVDLAGKAEAMALCGPVSWRGIWVRWRTWGRRTGVRRSYGGLRMTPFFLKSQTFRECVSPFGLRSAGCDGTVQSQNQNEKNRDPIAIRNSFSNFFWPWSRRVHRPGYSSEADRRHGARLAHPKRAPQSTDHLGPLPC
jgi:hypothetical protein